MSLSKRKRQKLLIDFIRRKELTSQQDLVDSFKKEGYEVNQSSISRDIIELGIVKMSGFYQIPSMGAASIQGSRGLRQLKSAGDSLIVALCEAGWASAVSAEIDRAKIPEIIGTIAGDDTIFIAVDGARDQKHVIKLMGEIFSNLEHPQLEG